MQVILLLAILGGLALLLVQNWSPVLPLVFLGLTTPALPLAVWILISLVAGAVTSVAIASLFNLANYFAQPKSSNKRQVKPPPRPQPSSNTYTKRPVQDTSSNDRADDWLEDSLNDEDWNYEENTVSENNSATSYPQDSRSYEVNSEPKSSKRQGSVYSYSYREEEEAESSGVGKSESVYDADYRVLTPPYKSPNPVRDDDDWGFDDFVDDEEDLRSARE